MNTSSTLDSPTARRIGPQRDVLGECPVWNVAEQALYWIDIRQPTIRRYRPETGGVESWPLPEMVGSIALAGPGRLLVALGSRVALFDTADASIRTLAALSQLPTGHRFNDGRCDPAGRFWIGTMHNETRAPEGTLYRLGLGGFESVLTGVRIPNSLCWSPDGRTMYFADSLDHEIGAFAFDPASGELGTRRAFARSHPPAFPDGATVDEEGCVWCAEFNGGRVACWHPDGRLVREIPVPVARPTSCAFGGPKLETLFVTTTCQHMSEAERAAEPLTGALLAYDIGARGRPEPAFDPRSVGVYT